MDEIVKIDLFGEEFRFKPDELVKDPDRVAQYLKDYIEEAGALFQNKASGRNRIAILLLAAMNLSRDFYELKQQYSELERNVEERISSLIYKIDKGIE
ncbi:MAG: cell division protein ZapA [Desulfobacteraceae bacterium]|nr:cell division protein ZapA [Desulfobacteraceae bacterium]